MESTEFYKRLAGILQRHIDTSPSESCTDISAEIRLSREDANHVCDLTTVKIDGNRVVQINDLGRRPNRVN